MKLVLGILFLSTVAISCNRLVTNLEQKTEHTREPVVGLPCEGCEAVFEGLPSSLGWSSRIAPEQEAGAAMRIEGTVRNKQGQPVSGVIVYAYHTNAKGIYPPDDTLKDETARHHGKLRAWVSTGADGRYRFDTIRPAGYPDTDIPEHVHMHIIEVGRCTYYIDDIMFEDDPRLTEVMKKRLALGRGGNGIIKPTKDSQGVWLVNRDILLGEAIADYDQCSRLNK